MKKLLFLLLQLCVLTVCSQEICNNGRDDDGDGKIDLNDNDCQCNGNFNRVKELSIIPNHSFESKNCCPVLFSQMACVNSWIQPSWGTSDFIHACGNYEINPDNIEPRVPNIPLPLPDGEGAVGVINGIIDGMLYTGIYKEYVGTRLRNPLEKDVAYQLDLSVGFGFDSTKLPPFNVVIWGHPQRNGVPFFDVLPRCPSYYDNQWIVLGSATVGGSNEWVKTTIDLTIPYDINSIAIGPDCARPTDSLLYYYLDNLVLYKKENAGKFYVDVVSSPKCSKIETLGSSLVNDDSFNYQWFKDGVAITTARQDSLRLQNTSKDNGVYQLMVSKSNTCQLSEPYNYTSITKSANFADLGPDIVACPGDTVTIKQQLNMVDPVGFYIWWNGNTYNSPDSLDVTQSGDYWIKIQTVDYLNPNEACFTSDTVHVSFEKDITPLLGPERYVCEGQPLEIGRELPGLSHKWNTGATTPTIVVTQPGIYHDTVSLNGCTAFGHVVVKPNALAFDLGKDVEACEGATVKVQPALPAGTNYLWNDGSNSTSYTATRTQKVQLVATLDGCVEDDAVNVVFKPSPAVELGSDTVLCESQAITLNANAIGASNYKWSTGSSEQTLQPTSSGRYTVHVTGTNGCTTSDTISVQFSPLPVIQLETEVALCRAGVVQLSPSIRHAQNVLWNDGFTSAQRSIRTTGTYTLQASNACGLRSATVEVKDAGICSLNFPNAFTPNHDGKNDVFRSNSFTGIEDYFLTIYNRWGQVIFHTADPLQGWNGTIAGKSATNGTYVWRAGFRDVITRTMRYENGSVLLLR